MHVYHRTTGSFFHSVPIGYDVRGMVLMDSQNKILVVGNDNGNSHFMFYNNETNAMNAVFNFYESSQVSGIWPGDNGSFYVAHTAGIAYYTNYLDQYVINSTLQPSEIHFEHLSGAVYAIVPNDGIHILSQNCGNEIGFVAGSDYFDVLFHYNK
jgi:ligand-binding sensor domain-containing protein